MGARLRKIAIIGGGTTGWLAAAILNHRLQWGFGHGEKVEITLIESPNIPVVGVGEATIPAFRDTLAALEIDEAEFVTRTDATFKHGILFENWNQPHGDGDRFFHPFSSGAQIAGRSTTPSFLTHGPPLPFDADWLVSDLDAPSYSAAAVGKAPKRVTDRDYAGPLRYAYHLDASRLGQLLREVAIARGVKAISDTVTHADLDERGHIKRLHLDSGNQEDADLFVDCSGFRRLLIGEMLGEPQVVFGTQLLNDRAVAVQVAKQDCRDKLAATRCTAMESGWRWRIPLRSRIGTGYVFSSSFIDDAAATDALTSALTPNSFLTDLRIVPMLPGRCRRSWVGNCVALGLASGFVEPLESTSIQMVDYACRRLLQLLPTRAMEPSLQRKFNLQMEIVYEEIADFLGLHFFLGRADTPYWKAAHFDARRSDRLNECLDIWRTSLPDIYDPRTTLMFSHLSVTCILLGKSFYRSAPATGSAVVPKEIWDRHIRDIVSIRRQVLDRLPPEQDFLEELAQRCATGSTAGRSPARSLPQPSSVGGVMQRAVTH